MREKKNKIQKKSIYLDEKFSDVKVSVVIPFKDNEVHIRQCVDSIVCQSLSEIQVLCLNQGSTDTSVAILSEFFGKDKRVKIISQTEEKKLDRCIKGKYVVILNPNDYLDLVALERLYQKAIATNSDIVFNGLVDYNDQSMQDEPTDLIFQKEKIPQRHTFSAYDYCEFLFDMVPMTNGCYMYKKDLLNEVLMKSTSSICTLSTIFEALILSSQISFIDSDFLHHRPRFNNQEKGDPIREFKEIQQFLNKFSFSQYKFSFIQCFLNIFWIYHNKLKEPERSLFDLNLIEVLSSISDCLDDFKQHPIYSLSLRPNLSSEFLKEFNNKSYSIIPIIIPTRWEIDAYNAAVTIQSIIDQVNPNFLYDIHILHLSNLKEEIKNQLESLSRNHIRVSCLNIEGILPKMFSPHIKDAFDYHLFLMNEIFSDYSKVLYLKPQVIVKKNLHELFNVDITNFSIAGTTSYYQNINYVEKDLGLIWENFINTDVLLFNLETWKKENLFQRCLDLTLVPLKQYKNFIRDIINYVCADKICILPDRYNGMRSFILGKDTIPNYSYSPESFDIINYNDEKPWKNPELELMDIWWFVARETSFYETILFRNIIDKIKANMPKQAKPEPIRPKTPSSIQKISPIAIKQQILQHKNDDSLYPLLKEYIKEAFYYCFTFGNSKKNHREALQKISQEIAMKTAR